MPGGLHSLALPPPLGNNAAEQLSKGAGLSGSQPYGARDGIIVLVTAGSREEADRLAGVLLDGHLVACVNIVQGITSHYWWKGRREQSTEILLVCKTLRRHWSSIYQALKENHSYELFEAVAISMVESSQEYLNWIEESTVHETVSFGGSQQIEEP